ncbi:Protein yippee-like [Mycena venus]|uniref:Protein yippee-like n=1 Tax=Mycena venus TaxID=2733690 RepID=A0A8H7D4G6_9AGAR|nr:Protein yippee-like [Mycena venus]
MPALEATHSPRRRLPAVPQARARPLSRPLPPIPKPLSCKQCKTTVTSYNATLPASAIPPESRTFRGFSGKASLFTETYNTTLLPAKVQLMQTGAHLLAEITCTTCTAYLGVQDPARFRKV